MIGDRVPVGPVEFVVVSLDASGAVETAGLVIDPAERLAGGMQLEIYRFISAAVSRARDAIISKCAAKKSAGD